MTTRSQAVNWARQQVYKALDFDGRWGAQCVDLIAFYLQYMGIEWLGASAAKDIYKWDDKRFSKHDKPEPGDIAVWGEKVGSGYGHCAIVLEVSGSRFKSVDQNYINFSLDRGSAGAIIEHGQDNVLGFVRPKFNPEPEAVPQPEIPAQPGTYTIKRGDTFWGLEEANGWAHGTLVNINPGIEPRNLQIGQSINVPQPPTQPQPTPPRKYTILRGDTFWGLEEHFGWAHGTLQGMNPSVNPRMLQIGQEINIPG